MHYHDSIRNFGPPLAYWTARYESKHRVAKNACENAKNFINISFTLAERQQLRMASVYFQGMFETEKYRLPEKVFYKGDIAENTEFETSLREFMGPSDIICNEIEVRNVSCKKGQAVVIEAIDRYKLKVGVIMTILVKTSGIYLVTKRCEAQRNNLEYFTSVSELDQVSFVNARRLQDYKPLQIRGTHKKFVFPLHL